MVVACCQLAPTLGDPAANRKLVTDAVTKAVASGAQVVVLPELVLSGYMFTDTAEAAASAEAIDGETLALWARLAHHHGIVIVGGRVVTDRRTAGTCGHLGNDPGLPIGRAGRSTNWFGQDSNVSDQPGPLPPRSAGADELFGDGA